MAGTVPLPPDFAALLKQAEAARDLYLQHIDSIRPKMLETYSAVQTVLDKISQSAVASVVDNVLQDISTLGDQAMSVISQMQFTPPAPPLTAALTNSLNAQLVQMGEVFGQYALVKPSPALARWLDAGLHDQVQPNDEAEPPEEEVETFWLSAVIVVAIFVSIFAAAVKTRDWNTAERIIAMFAAAGSLFLSVDWVMKKTMK